MYFIRYIPASERLERTTKTQRTQRLIGSIYSVFQSAEVQKLWVLGKRQEAEGKREEK
ncbi:hypothetical protein [Microcystis aeruginosa]|uniref:hypothetical protein n=1 Tax=Microcystis aeruginosa TaxID=1126 RepID=UPI0015597575|nr:hypothetical protein [Microcystis aeruginosa]